MNLIDIKFNDEDCHGLYQRGFILSSNIINKGDVELKNPWGWMACLTYIQGMHTVEVQVFGKFLI